MKRVGALGLLLIIALLASCSNQKASKTANETTTPNATKILVTHTVKDDAKQGELEDSKIANNIYTWYSLTLKEKEEKPIEDLEFLEKSNVENYEFEITFETKDYLRFKYYIVSIKEDDTKYYIEDHDLFYEVKNPSSSLPIDLKFIKFK